MPSCPGTQGSAGRLKGAIRIPQWWRPPPLPAGYAVSLFSPVSRPLVPYKAAFAVCREVTDRADEQPGPLLPTRHIRGVTGGHLIGSADEK